MSWTGFQDPESGVAEFYLQIYQGDSCNEGEIGEDHFVPISETIDVKNQTSVSLYEFYFEEG